MNANVEAGRPSAFTIIELLIVMTIILVLAGLVLATAGYVQKKGARSRTEAEIAAMSAALESYKADNGVYPTNPDTIAVDAKSDLDPITSPPNKYTRASLYLYEVLSGDSNADRTIQPSETGKSYINFKPNQLIPKDQTMPVTAIADPFGNSYGYSTAFQADPTHGYNPTFDLWSTAGGKSGNDVSQWIKNW